MIKNISYEVTFPTNNKKLSGQLSFEPGSTAIVGPNGAGKTFATLEMVRYLLFGSKALRGPASDYKKLKANGTFTIAGEDYTITRHPNDVKIEDSSGEVLAVKTEAVNQKVVELLGFGLDVFDITNCARQKESAQFSKMKPAPRKKLIDDILKLSSQEKVEAACKTEAKQHRKTAEALTRTLVVPVEPQPVDGYRPVADIQAEIEKERKLQREWQAYNNQGAAPVEPSMPRPLNVPELQRLDRLHRQYLADLKNLEGAVVYDEEVLQAAERYNAMLALGPKPQHPIELAEAWFAYFRDNRIPAHCPKCSHDFEIGVPRPEGVELSELEVRDELKRHRAWAGQEEVEKPEIVLTAKQIDQSRRLAALEPVESVEAELEAARAAEAEWSLYDRQMSVWFPVARPDEEPKGNIDELTDLLVKVKVYDSEIASYERATAEYEKTKAAIDEELAQAADFELGAQRLNEVRTTIKAYLGPSLSRMASAVLADMTAGKMNSVVIDEEMNITVDKQDISTLSGAEETAANLAVRFALGQALTHRVFSAFIADEPDADMDDERVPASREAFLKMAERLDQVIVISHRSSDGFDQRISMR